MRDTRLWAALLIVHLLALAALAFGAFLQTRPVPMHDLRLADGEKLRCVSYAPFYRPGQTPFDETLKIGREQIEADLAALAKISDCVRLYSIDQGLDQVPEIAREVGLGVLLGAWIGRDPLRNARELDRAIAIANAYPDVVRALIVGNEVLLRRERTPEEMRALIRSARARAKVPVTYADVWEFWMRNDTLAAEVDFVTVHILPFWEDQPVEIEQAIAHVAQVYDEVERHFDKPLLIGETGWPSAGRQREQSLPSAVNQARYIREFVHQAHAKGWNYNLIEAIDQPWKRRLEGTVGGYWGMLDTTLAPKFPLAGPVVEREGIVLPLAAAGAGLALALALAVLAGRTAAGPARLAAIALGGATGGLIAALGFEHAQFAYRDALEWSLLGGLGALALLLPALLAFWRCDSVPTAIVAWHRIRSGNQDAAAALALLRFVFLFAAAIAALLLFADPRYRDFPTLLYLAPALLYGVLDWLRGERGIEERVCSLVLALAVVGRWSSEPANLQAIAWLLVGLALAAPALRRRAHEQQ